MLDLNVLGCHTKLRRTKRRSCLVLLMSKEADVAKLLKYRGYWEPRGPKTSANLQICHNFVGTWKQINNFANRCLGSLDKEWDWSSFYIILTKLERAVVAQRQSLQPNTLEFRVWFYSTAADTLPNTLLLISFAPPSKRPLELAINYYLWKQLYRRLGTVASANITKVITVNWGGRFP